MKLQLNQDEIEKIISSILCNGALSFAGSSGLDYEYDREHYKQIKTEYPTLNSYEDILLQMLKADGQISFTDIEGDGEYSKDLTMTLITEKLTNVTDVAFANDIVTALRELNDAEVDYNILQYILYDDVVFG